MRPTAKELLKHPIFDKIRIPENEVHASHKIILAIDVIHPIEYEKDEKKKNEDEELMTVIKMEIIREVVKLHAMEDGE